MNRVFSLPNQRFLYVVAVLAAMLLGGAASVRADDTNDIPEKIKKAADAGPNRGDITAAIAVQIAAVQKEDTTALEQGTARDWLISNALYNTNQSQTSLSYIDVYTSELNKAIVPMLKSDSLRVRINAAIIVARVAGLGRQENLLPAVHAIFQDESQNDGVITYGMEAAKSCMSNGLQYSLLKPSDRDVLAKEIVKVVSAVSSKPNRSVIAGEIAKKGYDALAIAPNILPDDKSFSVLLDAMLDLQANRQKLYQGMDYPDSPNVEVRPLLYISDAKVWKASSSAQKNRAGNLGCDLITLAAKAASEMPSNDSSALIVAVREECDNFKSIVTTLLHNNTNEKIFDTAHLLHVGDQPRDILSVSKQVVDVVKSLPEFKSGTTVSVGP